MRRRTNNRASAGRRRRQRRARAAAQRRAGGAGRDRARTAAGGGAGGVPAARGAASRSATGRRSIAWPAGPAHQGVVADAPPFRYAALEEICGRRRALRPACSTGSRTPGTSARSCARPGPPAWRGWSCPRTAASGSRSVVVAASAGTLFGLPIARVPNLVRAMRHLKDAGILAGRAGPGGARQPLRARSARPRRPGGRGGRGAASRPLVRRTCDFEVRIPMAPGVESLNVSVATGVALFELRRRTGQLR